MALRSVPLFVRVPALAPRTVAAVAALALAALSIGCGGKRPTEVGLGPLAPCPDTPNCVSSLAPASSEAYVEPFALAVAPADAWPVVLAVVEDWRRMRVVEANDDALHAEAKSLVFRFVDDVELRLRASSARIDVRSASRVGRSDLGVNRRRVEALREALVERGVVSPGSATWEVAP